MRMVTEADVGRPIPRAEVVRRRRVIKAPKLPPREEKEGALPKVSPASPAVKPQAERVREMTGGGSVRRLQGAGILPAGSLGDEIGE